MSRVDSPSLGELRQRPRTAAPSGTDSAAADDETDRRSSVSTVNSSATSASGEAVRAHTVESHLASHHVSTVSTNPAEPVDAPTGKPTLVSAWWTSRKLRTYRYGQVPHYLQDNEYIHTGYRASYSFTESWASMLFVHNETGNIWTHFLGLLMFVALMASTTMFLPSQAGVWDHVVFGGFLASACACFLFSTLFHTHYCNNRDAYVRFGCLDYAGISILICGSATLVTYYVLACDPLLRTIYLTLLLSVSFVGIVGPYFAIWATSRFRVWRTIIYVASGILSGVPIFHYVFKHGIPTDMPWWAMYGWFVMGGTYIVGATIYASKVPERWWPGRFDYFGHSHQIWHCFVVAAACVHAYSAVELMAWRVEQSCPVA
ncbi:hemolysin III family channel protein [Allomyces macrogynus ATCC 38327]|uniref:Hemolysin III family channel protein n=1 Tax=Allomyces macrogynus (strain ATCC 38327) TaxID=578462 RepID=A0A0L0T8R6_ALLM3|nr:hemolysin III family channel protein [Allomyces macrogynus ATCC 38327]|eukprot:KNE71110.1 hemolysin III family channel protein [Allomyces macrogynus ATCC 38327]